MRETLIDRVLLELAVERPLADPQILSGFSSVAVGLAERGIDRGLLDVGHGHAWLVDDGLFGPCGIERIQEPGAGSRGRVASNFDHFDAF